MVGFLARIHIFVNMLTERYVIILTIRILDDFFLDLKEPV